MRARRAFVAAAVAASVIVALAGCGAGPRAPSRAESTDAAPALDGALTVFAAASLQHAFDDIAAAFEVRNPGVDVLPIVYDGSSTLVTQLIEGAPADVFAAADEKSMQKVTHAGLATDPRLFAANTLVVAMPKGNPGEVEDLEDLGDDSVTVVLCAPEVPCGAASQTLLANHGVGVTPASLEQNVAAVLTKVLAGEADAGLVYATDVQAEPGVDSFVPVGADEVVNRYPIATLAGGANPRAAAAFVSFVMGPEGRKVLASHGFGAP